jgi:hypothetical protein
LIEITQQCAFDGYHRKAGQKGASRLFVSSQPSRLKRVPLLIKQEWSIGRFYRLAGIPIEGAMRVWGERQNSLK